MNKETYSEKKKYRGSASASQAEIDAVGGEKTLSIDNVLFQGDLDAGNMADDLLARLKERKKYYRMKAEFVPIPVEINDTISAEEFLTPSKSKTHLGLIRQIRLSVTPNDQTLELTLEE